MKIGIDALSLKPGRTGGGETYIANLVRNMAAIDPDNDYVLFVLEGVRQVLGLDGPNVSFVELRMPASGALTVPARIAYEQIALPPKIVRAGIDVMLFLGNMVSLRCPCRCAVTIHDLSSYFYAERFPGLLGLLKGKILPEIVRRSAGRADRISASSESTKREIVRRFGVAQEKVEVVYLGVDSEFGESDSEPPPTPPSQGGAECAAAPSQAGALSGSPLARGTAGGRDAIPRLPDGVTEPYVLFVGTIDIHKNLERLATAFAAARKETGLPHMLVLAGMAGTGSDSLARHLRQLDSSEIVLVGAVDETALVELYRRAALFAFPSLYEGFGLPPLEAMRLGVPVVAAEATSIPEVVGDAAILFDPCDTASISAALVRGLTDEELRRDLREKGFARASRFTWRATAQKMLQIVGQLHTGGG